MDSGRRSLRRGTPGAAEYLRVLVDGEGRSVGTARAYAGRLALWLTWAAGKQVDGSAPAVEELASFARWLERTPSRKHRRGRNRRRAADPSGCSYRSVPLGWHCRWDLDRGGGVRPVLRFPGARRCPLGGGVERPAGVAFPAFGWDRGERTGRPVVDRRRVRRRRVQSPPETLSSTEVAALVDACANSRDRLIVEGLYGTGLRVAEFCGLHLSDLHFVPSAAHLGCKVDGAHLHVVRREDNENGALAKSIYPRVVPVAKDLVWLCNAYRAERDTVPAAAESDYLLVNLWRPPLGRALRPDTVERLFVRLSAKVGFRARPHLLASQLRFGGGDADQGPRPWSRNCWGTTRCHRPTCTCTFAGMTCGPPSTVTPEYVEATGDPAVACHTWPGRSGRNRRRGLAPGSGCAAWSRTAIWPVNGIPNGSWMSPGWVGGSPGGSAAWRRTARSAATQPVCCADPTPSSCSDREFPASRSGCPRMGPVRSAGGVCLGPAP